MQNDLERKNMYLELILNVFRLDHSESIGMHIEKKIFFCRCQLKPFFLYGMGDWGQKTTDTTTTTIVFFKPSLTCTVTLKCTVQKVF